MTKCSLLHFILFSFLLFSCQEKAAVDLQTLEDLALPVTLPASAPDDWLLAHIDVETTGLLPGYHEMIDIGIVMTRLDGELLDSLFLRIQPQHPERLSQGAFAVNAYDAKKWKEEGALSSTAAVDSLIAFHQQLVGDKHVLMVANNCQFDTAFLDHLFRSAGKTWRELYYYYVLDIPSMAWGLGLRDLTNQKLMQEYHIADEPHTAALHTGITGAMKNVRIYRALLRYRAEIGK
jgi:DNA polymerase III alpha subunit (gram-positive type)